MPLETLREGARTNVKRTSVEIPEVKERLPFDPERDLNRGDFACMVAAMETKRESDPREFGELAVKVSQMFPNRIEELNLDNKTYEILRKKFVEIDTAMSHKTSLLLSIKILYPEKYLASGPYGKFRDLVINYFNQPHLRMDYLRNKSLLQIKRLFPESADEIDFDKVFIEETQERLQNAERTTNKIDYLHRLRLIAPDVFNKIKISDQDWDVFRKVIQEYADSAKEESNQGEIFVNLAYMVFILSAKDVKLGKEGLEITRPQIKKPKTPGLPITKEI